MAEQRLRDQMVVLARAMYERGYIAGAAGNLSAGLPNGHILITPSGVNKSKLTPEELLIVDLSGHCVAGQSVCVPSSEMPMHLEVYRQRRDVGGVVHAHPVTCIALSLVGIGLEEAYIPEAVAVLGPVPTTRVAMPSSEENRDAIVGLVAGHDAMILAHHGSLTLGRDLEEAYDRLEVLEHTAQSVALAHRLGTPRRLPDAMVERLRQGRGGYEEDRGMAARVEAEVRRILGAG